MMRCRVGVVGVIVGVMVLTTPVPGSSQCNMVPYDSTAETAFGVGAGYVIEYCTGIVVDPACTAEGWYWPVVQTTALTRGGGAQTTLDYLAVLRDAELDDPNSPGQIIAEGPAHASGIPPYTSFVETESWLAPSRSLRGTSFSCTRYAGNDGPNIYIIGDKSAGTVYAPTWGMDMAIGIWEPLTDPLVRSLGQAVAVAPYRAFLTGADVVPPDPTSAIAIGMAMEGDVLWVDDLSTMAEAEGAVHIESGEAGVNGPTICDLGTVTFPYIGTCPGLDGHLFVGGIHQHNVYMWIEFDDGDRRTAKIRGQIMPANLVFGDGFERGSTDNW